MSNDVCEYEKIFAVNHCSNTENSLQITTFNSHVVRAVIIHEQKVHSKKTLGYFNPILGQTWTNPAVGLNLSITFFIFDPKLG